MYIIKKRWSVPISYHSLWSTLIEIYRRNIMIDLMTIFDKITIKIDTKGYLSEDYNS